MDRLLANRIQFENLSKHEYLSSTKAVKRKRKSDSFDMGQSPVKQRNPITLHAQPDNEASQSGRAQIQPLLSSEGMPIEIIESEGGDTGTCTVDTVENVRRIGIPFPNDPFRFIPQAEKDLLDSYTKKNHQVCISGAVRL